MNQPMQIDTDYRDRYVAFLDILGFSQLTAQADQHPHWRAWLRQTIGAIKATGPQYDHGSGFRFVQFSDSIVISTERTHTGLTALVSSVTALVQNMLQRGILLRGGIAAGNFHHDDHLMFGPALIRAYAFEQHGAPPHVGIDKTVLEDMKPNLINEWGLKGFIATDPWDQTPMLHSLWQFGIYFENAEFVPPDFEFSAAKTAHLIYKNAKDMSSTPAARTKWKWMQDYWNQTVEKSALILRCVDYPDWDAEIRRVQAKVQARMAVANQQNAFAGLAPPPPR